MTYEQAFELLKKHSQTHLLSFYGDLNDREKRSLLDQIASIDFSLLSLKKDDREEKAKHSFLPLDALRLDEIEQRRDEFEKAGMDALREDKVAAVLLAGGQGTRLGFDKPKGCFNIGLRRDLYIFECLINNMLDVAKLVGKCFPLYIMTSDKNNADTVSFFKSHDFFGYDPSKVRFFVQEMAPSVDFNGKILLEDKGRISLSPNGNGGWFSSLQKAGYVDEMKGNGAEWVSIFAVDNVLQRINDPAFVGATLKSGAVCGAKVLRKNSPDEKIGVICLDNGRPSIVEYYEINEEMRTLRDETGELLYSFGVTLNYLFKIDALEKADFASMPYHVVEKKIPYINEKGEYIKPENPNGCKFERLAFDIIRTFDSCLPFEIVRQREFAPVKNPTGVDSVESARALLELNGVAL